MLDYKVKQHEKCDLKVFAFVTSAGVSLQTQTHTLNSVSVQRCIF